MRDRDLGVLTFLDIDRDLANNKQLTLTLNDCYTSALPCAPYPSGTSVSCFFLVLATTAEFGFVGLCLSLVYYSTTRIFICTLERLPILERLHVRQIWLFSFSSSLAPPIHLASFSQSF